MIGYTGSYPFLHISKTEQLPYEDVLYVADLCRLTTFGTGPAENRNFILTKQYQKMKGQQVVLICDAVIRQEYIRRGDIPYE